SPFGRPDESVAVIAVEADNMSKRPGDVIGNIAREAELSARLQRGGEKAEGLLIDETALIVALLRPGIGIENEDARQRSRSKALQQETGIVVQDADIGEATRIDLRNELRNTVHERL